MKERKTALILAFFFGGVGMHHFYLRQPIRGVLYFLFSLTLIPLLLGFIDFLVLAFMNDEQFDTKYNQTNITTAQVKVYRKKGATNPSFHYDPANITSKALQFLESVYLLHTTKNIDTLTGRYSFILSLYPALTDASVNKRYISDIQKAIDRYKALYYDRIPNEIELALLIKPNIVSLRNFYSECLNACFYNFHEEQEIQISALKRADAKERRKRKTIEVCKLTISELQKSGSTAEKHLNYISTLQNLLTTLDPTAQVLSPVPQNIETAVIIINDKGYFPLTLYGAKRSDMQKVTLILKDDNIWNKAKQLPPLFSKHNIKCKEIEAYIATYKPIYLADIEAQKKDSTEYQNALELDRLDIEREFKAIAIDRLKERADCNLQVLFEYNEIEATIDDPLIQRYGFDTLSKYLSLQHNNNKIISNWERNDFEDLVQAELAITADDLDVNEILLSQTLKTLNAICEKDSAFFKRKNKAIQHLEENPALFENIGKHIVTRKLFKLRALPVEFENIDLEKLSKHWEFLNEYVNLIANTYRKSINNQEQIKNNREWVSGFKITSHEDYNSNFVCLRAREEASKNYSKSKTPKAPFHIGCNCHLDSIA